MGRRVGRPWGGLSEGPFHVEEEMDEMDDDFEFQGAAEEKPGGLRKRVHGLLCK